MDAGDSEKLQFVQKLALYFQVYHFGKEKKMWKEYENRELLEKVVADTDRIIEKVRQGTVFQGFVPKEAMI